MIYSNQIGIGIAGTRWHVCSQSYIVKMSAVELCRS